MRYDYAWASERRQLLYPNRWLSHTRRATSFQEVPDREFLEERTFGDRLGAFPGLFGPVTLEVSPSCDVAHPEWWHLGDGGMIDNLGVDTLEEVVLEAAEAGSGSLSIAALLSFDAGHALRTTNLKRMSNYTLLSRDPSRIVTVTKARGNAYHDLAWGQTKLDLADRGVRADKIALRYMAAELESWPASCRSEARRSAATTTSQVGSIRDRLEEIPTLLSIDDCGADRLEQAAHHVVHESLNGEPGQRLRDLGIPVRAARD